MEVALQTVRETGKFTLLRLDNLPQEVCQCRDGFNLKNIGSEGSDRKPLVRDPSGEGLSVDFQVENQAVDDQLFVAGIHDPKLHIEDLFEELHIFRGYARNIHPGVICRPQKMSAAGRQKNSCQPHGHDQYSVLHIQPPANRTIMEFYFLLRPPTIGG